MSDPPSAQAGDAVRLLFRHAIQERMLALFPRGARVLSLGCGAGHDEVVLAAQGRRVHGVDASAGKVAGARARAAARGLEGLATFHVARPEAPSIRGRFDGAHVDLGAVPPAETAALGVTLTSVLLPGAPVVLRVPGWSPLPALVQRALTGEVTLVPGDGPTSADPRPRLGAGFRWRPAAGYGVLIPAAAGPWAVRHPQAFGLLAALERGVRGWPVLRERGHLVILEGRLG